MSDTNPHHEITERPCPHCAANTPIAATFCPHCTRRLHEFVECPDCLEPIAKKAKFCPYCNQRIRRYQTGLKRELPTLDLAIRSHRLGELLRNFSASCFIRPTIIHVNHDRILIQRWRAFGFAREDQTTPLPEIRRINFKKGIFWGTIIINPAEEKEDETEPLIIRALTRRDAKLFAHRVNAELERL